VPDPDPAGYYRALGVPPGASRAELVRAYLRAGGPGSADLTCALTQLLDRASRARYDRTPLGRRFVGPGEQDAAVAAVLRATGIRTEEVVKGSLEEEDGARTSRQFGYGYYLWRCASADQHRLARWQALVVRAMNAEGIVAQVAVGVAGGAGPHPAHARVGGVDVLILPFDSRPTWALARAAVAAYRSHRANRANRVKSRRTA
jgi:hypothetical protein